MTRRKTVLFLLVSFAAVLACLAVCWRHFHELNREDQKDYEVYSRHYVMITGREDSDFWDRVYERAREEGRERGVYVERFGGGSGCGIQQKRVVKTGHAGLGGRNHRARRRGRGDR